MLLSELEERGRRFKLALRAGIPILLLVALIVYIVFLKEGALDFTTENYLLLGAVIFISIYFIYFLLEQDAQETLLDQKTHGFNQHAFEKLLKRSKSKTIALLHISNLSSINENYGVQNTNILLYSIIQKLDQSLENSGLGNALIGRRYGAELLIAINERQDDLRNALERFAKEHHTINDIDVAYRFSVITYSGDGLEKAIIYLKNGLSHNDTHHTAKSQKNEIQDASSISRLEDAVVASIEAKHLSFLFRPLQHTKTGKVDIYEVMVKLYSSSHGDILPKTFLPIVNRLGLGRAYDLAIVDHLIKLLPLLDRNISLTFNISPFSLRSKRFQEKFFTLLDKSDIDNSRLIIELYERKTYHDLSHYFQTLNYMRSKGLRIAIDNFGSSNASMEYMKHFKFDLVQFDRDYVTKLEDTVTYEMLRSLVAMSQNLHITTIAKWVDKPSQKTALSALGIDYVQGFGVGKPISEKELIDRYN